MKGTYIFLANGFEETEAIAPADMLRRGGAEVRSVSIYSDKYVTGAHGITVAADMTFGEFLANADMSASDGSDIMVFPGGLPGATNLAEKTELMDIMRKHYAEGGAVAAICASPGVVLTLLPEISGKKMTCYDGFDGPVMEKGAEYVKEGVVTDGRMITGRGPGFAIDFGLALVAYLKGEAAAKEVKAGLLL